MTTTPEATITRGPAERAAARPGALRWFDICSYAELTPERGACAMVAGTQVAVFRTFDGALYALSNLDPFSGAHVVSRGILGTRGGVPTVASPMYKQVFDLRTGACLDTQGKDERSLTTWPVAVRDGDVFVRWAARS